MRRYDIGRRRKLSHLLRAELSKQPGDGSSRNVLPGPLVQRREGLFRLRSLLAMPFRPGRGVGL